MAVVKNATEVHRLVHCRNNSGNARVFPHASMEPRCLAEAGRISEKAGNGRGIVIKE